MTNCKITKITLILNGKEYEYTLEEAEALYRALHDALGKKETVYYPYWWYTYSTGTRTLNSDNTSAPTYVIKTEE